MDFFTSLFTTSAHYHRSIGRSPFFPFLCIVPILSLVVLTSDQFPRPCPAGVLLLFHRRSPQGHGWWCSPVWRRPTARRDPLSMHWVALFSSLPPSALLSQFASCLSSYIWFDPPRYWISLRQWLALCFQRSLDSSLHYCPPAPVMIQRTMYSLQSLSYSSSFLLSLYHLFRLSSLFLQG